MKFFTVEEQRVLLVLLAFLVTGLLVRQVRQPATLSTADEQASKVAAAQSFREASKRFVATANDPLAPVDVNHASVEELQALRGVGPVLAKKIVDFRAENGYFRTVQDLRQVSGIGPRLLQRWEGSIIARSDTSLIETDSDH